MIFNLEHLRAWLFETNFGSYMNRLFKEAKESKEKPA